jgi:elongation of very long chain fatty acids protein 4
MSVMTSARTHERSTGSKASEAPVLGSAKRQATDSSMPIETVVAPPSAMARLTALSVLVGAFSIWWKYTFIDPADIPSVNSEVHSYKVTLALTAFYLLSLPLLRIFSKKYLAETVDVKLLLRESMILYNGAQVLLNGWIVYRIMAGLLSGEHPFVGADLQLVSTGVSYAVWVHYCDKYLEFLDTFFMVLRGKMDQVRNGLSHEFGRPSVKAHDSNKPLLLLAFTYRYSHNTFPSPQRLQVSFLHVYHHTSIAWAWWIGLRVYPGGDIYFGALLNSVIHVMMYSYYTCSLLRISCPWKKYLTQAQLLQFISVLGYSAISMYRMPEGADWTHYVAHCVQDAEMLSLFILFMHFYAKAYRKRRFETAQKVAELTASTTDSDSGSDTAAEQASISSDSSQEDRDEQS